VTINPGDAGKHFFFHEEENFMPKFTNDPVVSVSNSPNAPSVLGESTGWEGVDGVSHGKAAGVAGFNDGPQGAAAHGVYGESQHWERGARNRPWPGGGRRRVQRWSTGGRRTGPSGG
jgi:hypothetical protein